MSNELKQVSIKLEPVLHQRLQDAAERDHRPLASFIRKLCADAVARSVDQQRSAA